LSVADPAGDARSSVRHRIAFLTLLAGVFGVLFLTPFAVAEVGLRLAGWNAADDPYISMGRIPPFFARTTVDGVPHYRMTNWETYAHRNITFPVVKEAGAFRVFCVGGSASAGWPHPPEEIYSEYLRQALQRSFPDRTIEVINASAHAYAAYRVRLIVQEVVRFDPDLIIIYSGNNEFLEKRLYRPGSPRLQPLRNALNSLVTYRMIRGSQVFKRLFPDNTLRGEHRDHVVYSDWSKIAKVALELRRDSAQLARLEEHYEFSLRSMVELAGHRGIPVMILTTPTNLRHWEPNVSHHSLPDDGLAEWRLHFRAGRAALVQGEYHVAVEELARAVALDPAHAESHFQLARALEGAGRLEEALRSYVQARDLDHNPFRATSNLIATQRRVAAESPNASLVDAEAAFEAESAPFAPGFDLLLDYVHPTKRGNLVLARTVFDAIVHSGLLRPPAGTGLEFTYEPVPAAPDGVPYEDERDLRMQGFLVQLFAMMHQYESALDRARFVASGPPATDTIRRFEAALVESLLRIFPGVLEVERKSVLGLTTAAEEERAADDLMGFFRAHYRGYEEFQRRYMHSGGG
jgi:tetratricopeptide (TPR) repeat protein